MLDQIYRPIKKELAATQSIMRRQVERSRAEFIVRLNRYLEQSKGKQLRPALVILSSKAALRQPSRLISKAIIELAAAVELSHLASLIHDDVVDHAKLRRQLPTVNARWGQETSIIFGDYLYSIAFSLITSYGNTDILACVSHATRLMCEGELVQISQRNNFSFIKDRYLGIIKNKTANLFAASCRAGALAVQASKRSCDALYAYGLNLGIAFQIVDDTLDLVGRAKDLGKAPGSDYEMGELTLPIRNLLSMKGQKKVIYPLIKRKKSKEVFLRLRELFIHSAALSKTKQDIHSYIVKAKHSIAFLDDSPYKESLNSLADYINQKI